MRHLLFLIAILLFSECFAQRTIDVGKEDVRLGTSNFNVVGGTPFLNVKYVRLVEGSPYFKDKWMKGILISTGDEQYKNLTLKLDLIDNKIHYKDEKGNEFIATTPVKEAVLTDDAGNNYKFVRISTLQKTNVPVKDGWCLWLGSGAAALYKFFNKNVYEQTPYNSATTEQYIKTTEKYMVVYNNLLIEIKKIKDAPGVLANKKAELEEYLKNKDNAKESMDDRFAHLIEYYNSLFPEEKK